MEPLQVVLSRFPFRAVLPKVILPVQPFPQVPLGRQHNLIYFVTYRFLADVDNDSVFFVEVCDHIVNKIFIRKLFNLGDNDFLIDVGLLLFLLCS